VTLFWTSNNAMPTTAAQALQSTGTAIRTMLQVAPPSTRGLKVVAFGVEFANALTAACTVELIDTGTVAATGLTAHVAAGVQPYDDQAAGVAASSVGLGTGTTGYTASTTCTEGSITATRTGKYKVVPIGAAEYEWEWSYGREFSVPASHFLRVRMTTGTTVNAYTWVLWDE
jgi:hypothetical protein